MQRVIKMTVGAIVAAMVGSVLAQPGAGDPTMRILDAASDAAVVERELEAPRAADAAAPENASPERRARRRAAAEPSAEGAAPRRDRAAQRRRHKLDEHDDERGESALDDDDIEIVPAPPAP